MYPDLLGNVGGLMTTIFVAGATGFTGREVMRLMAADGHETIAHVRPDSSRLEHWRAEFEAMGAATDTTAWDEAAMTARMAEAAPDVVFGLLGTTRKRASAAKGVGADDSYETVDYGLTALLIRACVAAGHRPRFVYLSAMGIRAKRPSGAYGLARWKVEQDLTAAGLPYTIARPSFIVGPGRDDGRPGERVGAAAVDGLLSTISFFGARKLADKYRSQTNTELATSLARLALDPRAENRTVSNDELCGR